MRDDRGDPRPVLGVERDIHDLRIGKGMRLIAGADDDGRDLRLLQHPGAGDGGDVDAVAVADRLQGPKQCWKRSQPPKSSMISLYLTSERFSSGVSGSGDAKPFVAEEAAGHRTVAEEA